MTGRRYHLNQVIRNPQCTHCALHESTTNVCVMGRGNPRARIMLVGEAPGEAEARTGKPFMGRAGKLLDLLLLSAGLTGRVYVTNVAKCRPPNNRTPTTNEASICSQFYLEKEIVTIRPSAIVLLGRVAINWIFKGDEFTRHCANVHPNFDGSVIPTWHPSYVLRTGGIGSKTAKELLQSLEVAEELVYGTA